MQVLGTYISDAYSKSESVRIHSDYFSRDDNSPNKFYSWHSEMHLSLLNISWLSIYGHLKCAFVEHQIRRISQLQCMKEIFFNFGCLNTYHKRETNFLVTQLMFTMVIMYKLHLTDIIILLSTYIDEVKCIHKV